MTDFMEINWAELKDIAERLSQTDRGGGRGYYADLEAVDQALAILIVQEDLVSIVKLRNLFTTIVARDSIGIHASLQRLTEEAICATDQLGDIKEQAHFLGANGHNRHRQGLHQRALEDFYHSYQLYEKAGESFEALKSYYMMALCQRALGNTADAKHILTTTISQVDPEDPWLGNPFVV